MCVCLSLVSYFLETIKVIVIKLGMVTASDMRLHHMLIILTFIQGHTDLSHENNTCCIISETFQAMPIKFVVKTKGLYNRCQSKDIDLHSRSELHLKSDKFLTGSFIVIFQTIFNLVQLGMAVGYAWLICSCSFDDFDLDARLQWLGRGNNSTFLLSQQLSMQ